MVKSICFTGHRHIAKEKLPAALAELRRVLDSMQIQLLDHIVLGKSGETISMRQVMGWSEI